MGRTSLRLIGAATAVALMAFGLGTPAAASADGLDGTIKDAINGAPVSSAGVQIEWMDGSHWNFTNPDATGYFSFPNQAAGQYRVHVFANGYVEQYLYGHTNYYEADPVTVPGTIQVQLMPIQYGTVAGRVKNANGEALKDVFVELDHNGNQVATTATDKAGKYHFDRVETGDGYTIQVRYPNGQNVWYENSFDSYGAKPFSVNVSGRATINMTQGPVGNLTLQAYDADTGAALTGICFYHQDGPDNFGFETICTDTSGQAKLVNIPVGGYSGGSYDQNNVYLNGHFDLTTVVADRTTTATLRLHKGGNVHVTFVDAATGNPIDGGACASLADPAVSDIGSPGNCGSPVNFLNYFPQKFRLFTQPYDGVHGAQWLGVDGHGTGDPDQAKVWDLTYGSDFSITVPLDGAGSIRGTIRDAATGAGVSNVCPRPTGPSPFYGPYGGTMCTYSGGEYAIDNLGPYAWKIAFPAYNRTNAWVWSGNAANRAQATAVQVVAGETVTVDAALPATGKITGKVVAPAGMCIQCTVIYAIDVATGDYAAAEPYVAADGSFTITGLNTQDVVLRYSGPNDTLVQYPTQVHTTVGSTISGIVLDRAG